MFTGKIMENNMKSLSPSLQEELRGKSPAERQRIISRVLRNSPIEELNDKYHIRAAYWKGATELTEPYHEVVNGKEISDEEKKEYFTKIINSMWRSFKETHARQEDDASDKHKKARKFFRELLYDLYRTLVLQYNIEGAKTSQERLDAIYNIFDFYVGSIPLNNTIPKSTVSEYLNLTKDSLKDYVLTENKTLLMNTPGYATPRNYPYVRMMRGGSRKDRFCSTLLTLFMIEADKTPDFDYETFMEKVDEALENLGQNDLVLEELRKLVDACLKQSIPDDGYLFMPSSGQNQEFAKALKNIYYTEFTIVERDALKSIAPNIIYHPEAPQEFQEILGTHGTYFLNRGGAQEEEVPFHGLDDDIVVNSDERKILDEGGIPAGAILVLYLIANCNAK
jgi:hypothetical protein